MSKAKTLEKSNLLNEEPLPLSVIAKQIPNRRGRLGVNPASVWRWTKRGIRGCKLECIHVGGIVMTTKAALQRFFEASTSAAEKQIS